MTMKKYENFLLKFNDISPVGRSTVFLKNSKTFLATGNGNIIKSTCHMPGTGLNSRYISKKLGDDSRSIFPEKDQRSTLSPSCYRLINIDN